MSSLVEGGVSTALRLMEKPLSIARSSPSFPSDELRAEELALIDGCRRGERAAMHTLYQRYRRRVFALIARICGADDAEELVQEVFLRAFRGLAKFRGEAQLSTWMYRLAVNAALTHATRVQARQRRLASEEELLAVPAPPTADGDPRLRRRVEAALAELPPGYRAVIVLHDVEGLQHDEIARILGCRVGTSKSQLHKARAQMRKKLEGLAP
jgi:RNA polymerase sigma-70 factor (ECF subfamily)